MALVDEQLRALFSGQSADARGIRLQDLRPHGLGLRARFHRDDSDPIELLLRPPGTQRRAGVRLKGFDVTAVGDFGQQKADRDRTLLQDVVDVLKQGDLRTSYRDWVETVGEAADDRFILGAVAEIKLTNRCDQRCVFCKSPKNMANHIPSDEVAEVLPRLARRTAFLTLSGGETLLSERLEEHVREARRGGFKEVEVQTNGMQLAEPGRVRRLKEAGLTNLLISLHAHEPSLSDRLTGTQGGFHRTVAGIERSLEAGLSVSLCHVICEGNFRVMPTYARFIRERFAGHPLTVLFTLAIPTYRVRSDPGLMPRLSLAAPLLRRALSSFESAVDRDIMWFERHQRLAVQGGFLYIFNRLGRHLHRHLTSIPPYRKLVQPPPVHDARVIRHCGLPVCALKDQAVYHDDILFGTKPPALEEMTRPPVCDGCTYRDRCAGLWLAYVERFGPDGIDAVSHPPPARVQEMMARGIEMEQGGWPRPKTLP
jgi:MoaA/NifB/PqqE/SkfB family radical SAM enzyme